MLSLTCDACPAIKRYRCAGFSTAQGGNCHSVQGVMNKAGHSVITAGVQISDLIIYIDPKARELAMVTGPGHNDLSVCLVWTYTLEVHHRACICSMKQKWLWGIQLHGFEIKVSIPWTEISLIWHLLWLSFRCLKFTFKCVQLWDRKYLSAWH